MRTLFIKNVGNQSDLELLEQIYTKVKLGEYVKFNGKAFYRIRTLNTKYAQYPYHFKDNGDIYSSSFLVEDDDGEYVNTLCQYKIIIKE